ncbi:MAG: hypothetical protein JSS27_11645 [Planctomycetes bacterium]|nr:hypothetical protein [Planctomycetota bacterium]
MSSYLAEGSKITNRGALPGFFPVVLLSTSPICQIHAAGSANAIAVRIVGMGQ